jgi:hypothetical protein
MSYGEFEYGYSKHADKIRIELVWHDENGTANLMYAMRSPGVMYDYYPRIKTLLAAGWQIHSVHFEPLRRIVFATHPAPDMICPFADFVDVSKPRK